MEIGDATYHFCRHCKCRRTYKVGLYNKTHPTSKHGGLKRGDLTKEEQDKSYPVDPNLGKTSVPHRETWIFHIQSHFLFYCHMIFFPISQ